MPFMSAYAPSRFPSYPPLATPNPWQAPVWQQQLLEASYRWATGYAFHLEKLGGLRRPNTYRAAHCMGELAPWLEGLSVHVYGDRLHPMVFTEGWGVDVGARQVWVDRELVERQLAQPEDKFQGANWFDQGWAEMWVLVADAMGAPRELVSSALEKSRLRHFLDKTQHVQQWSPPEVVDAVRSVPGEELIAKPMPLPLQEILTTEQALEFGWPFAKNRSDVWPSSEEHWLHWAQAAYFLHVQNGLKTAPEKVDRFLESALYTDWAPEWSFWIDLAKPGLESRCPGLLRAVQSPQAIPGLVAKGADPNACGFSEANTTDSILSNAIRFRPHLVPALVAAGAQWSSVPLEVNPWKEMAVHLGQAGPGEWAAIEQGLRLIPDGFQIQGQHLADMVRAFAKNHSFRGKDGLEAADVMERTLRWLGAANPGLDWLPVVEQMAELTGQDFKGSLLFVLEKVRDVDLNQVVFSNQQRLPVSLLRLAGMSFLSVDGKRSQNDGWWQRWEDAGVLWELTDEESSTLVEASQKIYRELQGSQRARAKEGFLEENLAPAHSGHFAPPGRRARL